jgi:hypothetical protein
MKSRKPIKKSKRTKKQSHYQVQLPNDSIWDATVLYLAIEGAAYVARYG